MDTFSRKEVLLGLGGTALASMQALPSFAAPSARKQPRAIAMWDFSWLERRWPGGGFEDWDRALDELVDRGYDAVRIDAFPHLVAAHPKRSWLLKPQWSVQDWGAPTFVRVEIIPALHDFIGRAWRRGIKVGLSTWFREDENDERQKITSPDKLADIWRTTLRGISEAGLLKAILYVDLCNEWPGPAWATFLQPPLDWGAWRDPRSLMWMTRAIKALRPEFKDLPLLFSGTSNQASEYETGDAAIMDAVDLHIWMAQANADEFYTGVGYKYDRFSEESYHNLQLHAASLYASRPAYWRKLLTDQIAEAAVASRVAKLPCMTTECWGAVDYKDWPMLPWDWVKELCALGTHTASQTGRWLAIATSNFCAPQFVGMWRDVGWHRELTTSIKRATVDPALHSGVLWERL